MRDDRHDEPHTNDKREYTDTGFRDRDDREGFGDDGGARVGRPDGARSASDAKRAPHDAQGGHQTPGQPGTNTQPVADGLEGAMTGDDDAAGPQQSRVQAASEGVDGGAKSGDDRRIDDL